MRPLALIVAGACLLGAPGCAKKDPAGRLPVSGKVTLKGTPLDQASIQFMAADAGGQFGSGGVIAKGEYSIPGNQGLPAGKYKVLISAGVVGPTPAQGELPGESSPPAEERIPPEFNVNSDKFVDVSSGKENVFNFDIP